MEAPGRGIFFRELQRVRWGWGAPGRPESKSQAVLGHFFVLTMPFVHQHPPSAPRHRTLSVNQEPQVQTHLEQSELHMKLEKKRRGSICRMGRSGGILKELFFQEASFFRQGGVFPKREPRHPLHPSKKDGLRC